MKEEQERGYHAKLEIITINSDELKSVIKISGEEGDVHFLELLLAFCIYLDYKSAFG